MTYFPGPFEVKSADSPGIDAFSRMRVSDPFTLFNSKNLNRKEDFDWSELTAGTGTAATYVANSAAVALSVSGTTAGSMVRQSRRRFHYQTGKSQLFFLTANIKGLVANVTKAVGAFDQNNGLFFKFTDVAAVTVRSNTSGSVVDTDIPQANWNLDKLDGTGPSGYTVDWTRNHIFLIDYQWLGTGRVRFGLDLDGEIVYVHESLHANVLDKVYMATPNLPLRYEIANDGSGAATTLEQICCSCVSEGGTLEPYGQFKTISTPSNGINYPVADPCVVFALRLKQTNIDAIVEFTDAFLYPTAGNDLIKAKIVRNPTIASTPTWNTSDFPSVEYFIGTPEVDTVTGGDELYTVIGVGGLLLIQNLPQPGLQLTSQADGTADVLALVLENDINVARVHSVLNFRTLS